MGNIANLGARVKVSDKYFNFILIELKKFEQGQ